MEITEHLACQISPDIMDMVEEEKQHLDDKLSQNKFAYMILKNGHYSHMDTQMQKFNLDVRDNVKRVRELE